MRQRYLALDVGGSKIEAGLVSETGRLLKTNRVPAQPKCPLDELLRDTQLALEPLLGHRVSGLGVGFPALGDYQHGVLYGDRSLYPCVAGFPLRDYLSERHRLPVRMTTDANLFALGVARFGEAHQYRNVLALTLGTGLGVGLIVDGSLDEGPQGIPHDILRLLHESDRPLWAAGHHFRRLYGAEGATLAERALQGEARAGEAFRTVGCSLAETIKRIISVVPPLDAVIVGGGVARSWRFFAPALRRGLQGLGVPVIRTRLKHPALLGGAALFADRP